MSEKLGSIQEMLVIYPLLDSATQKNSQTTIHIELKRGCSPIRVNGFFFGISEKKITQKQIVALPRQLALPCLRIQLIDSIKLQNQAIFSKKKVKVYFNQSDQFYFFYSHVIEIVETTAGLFLEIVFPDHLFERKQRIATRIPFLKPIDQPDIWIYDLSLSGLRLEIANRSCIPSLTKLELTVLMPSNIEAVVQDSQPIVYFEQKWILQIVWIEKGAIFTAGCKFWDMDKLLLSQMQTYIVQMQKYQNQSNSRLIPIHLGIQVQSVKILA